MTDAAPARPVKAYAHDRFTYPLPAGHRFPLGRYRLLRRELEGDAGLDIREARAVADDELALAHSPAYIARVHAGDLTPRERAALGLPWSPQLVERARRSVGATIQAAQAALADGVGVNLGGGTHHAAHAAGRGFCVFNDVVCATHALRAAGAIRRVLVVDLDVHQGDGTHACLAGDPDGLTVSVNGGANYPFRRVPGDIEVDLPDGAGDHRYLDAVEQVLAAALVHATGAAADVCFYLAGADPYSGDRLGRLGVSQAGLARRDRLVRDALRAAGIPVCVALAGGYAEPIEHTVAINAHTVRLFADGR